MGLLGDGDEPVIRKKSHQGKSVKLKYTEDVWVLMFSIRNNTPVNCMRLKNGKRSLFSLNESQCKSISHHCPGEGEGDQPPNCHFAGRPLSSVNENVDLLTHISTVVKNSPLIENGSSPWY